MTPETSALLQWTTWCAAFWIIVLRARRAGAEPRDALRLVLGLAAGAGSAWLGTALFAASREPAGFSILFVPVGVLLASAAGRSAADRARCLQLALPALPVGFAVARVGCVVSGCCLGVDQHPVALYEIALLVGLHALVQALRADHRPALALAGIGLVRLALAPIRSQAAGETLLEPTWVAAGWVLVGAGMLGMRVRAGIHERVTPGSPARGAAPSSLRSSRRTV